MATLVPRFSEAVRARLDAIGVPAKAIRVELEYVIDGREPNSIVTPLTGSVMLANVLVGASASSSTGDTVLPWLLPPRSPRAVGTEMDTPDDDLTDDHMRLLEWLDAHPTGSVAAAAQALGLAIINVEGLCADLVAAGMIERTRMQCAALRHRGTQRSDRELHRRARRRDSERTERLLAPS